MPQIENWSRLPARVRDHLVGGWPTFEPPRLRLPHLSRFSTSGTPRWWH